jgi:hypothetical protein
LDLLKKQDGEIEWYDNLPADTQTAITDLLTSFVGTIISHKYVKLILLCNISNNYGRYESYQTASWSYFRSTWRL